MYELKRFALAILKEFAREFARELVREGLNAFREYQEEQERRREEEGDHVAA